MPAHLEYGWLQQNLSRLKTKPGNEFLSPGFSEISSMLRGDIIPLVGLKVVAPGFAIVYEVVGAILPAK